MGGKLEELTTVLVPHEVAMGGLKNSAVSDISWQDSPFLDDDKAFVEFSESKPIRKCIPKCVVKLVCDVPVQLLLLLLHLVLIGIEFYELFPQHGKTMVVQIVIFVFFLVERMLLIFNDGKSHFIPLCQRYGLFDDVFLLISFILHLISWTLGGEKRKEALYIFQLFSLFPFLDGRIRRLLLAVRRRVSSERRRYRKGDFDLDIAFAHSTVGMMSWPAANIQLLFRNPASEVKRFLDEAYGAFFYRVYNLCSEWRYDPMLFDGSVAEYPMDDHNPAELRVMLAFVRDAGEFVRTDPPRRAVVVHCKGGKGRTGTMVCAYMMYTGIRKTAEDALRFFGQVRTAEGAKFQGVQTPSQGRYVRYFERLLNLANPPAPLSVPTAKKKIVELVLENIPGIWCKGGVGKLWFAVIINPCTERNVVYLSNPSVTFNPHPPLSRSHLKDQLRDMFVPPEQSLYEDSQKVNLSNEMIPCYDAFQVCFGNQWMSTACFDKEFSEETHSNRDVLNKRVLDGTPVTVKALNLSKIPVLDGDVVVKFFYAKNDPKALSPPLQFWFHTAMENDELRLVKTEVDGPHKDLKNRIYPEGFTVTLRMEASAG